ncbi:unnamed protein product [Allacma fusca]|uniref:Uncharacterized protein n=1 Tax=Allacma fusca TaxID=39272 RepID=A0A8J2NUH2_9HEXA|nr:unnamed protein product [Allacma fusca]
MPSNPSFSLSAAFQFTFSSGYSRCVTNTGIGVLVLPYVRLLCFFALALCIGLLVPAVDTEPLLLFFTEVFGSLEPNHYVSHVICRY